MNALPAGACSSFAIPMPHHLSRLDELISRYDHVFLSPHLDDAALSCGGTIAHYVDSGQPVLVVNVCTGEPSANQPLSSFAQHLHAWWKLDAGQAVSARLHEDRAALDHLGADSLELRFLDAIYRCPAVYTSDEALFGAIAPADPLEPALSRVLGELARRWPEATFYAPLGVGRHVDHQITHNAAAGMRVVYYEDFPYVTDARALERRWQDLGGRQRFAARTRCIDATLERKVVAIGLYASQIALLFGDRAGMDRAVRAYAAQVCPEDGTYGERVWARVDEGLHSGTSHV